MTASILITDEKIASLHKRWFELHPDQQKVRDEKDATPFSVRDLKSIPVCNKEESSLVFSKELIERLKRAGFLVDPPLDEQKKSTTNNNPLLRHLTDTTWIGNIAVGRDTRIGFEEWWALCLPIGCLISYVGKGARERALQKAEELKEHY